MLNRIWIPTPNYNASRSQNRLLVIHTAEGATNFHELGSFFANPASQVSSHVGIDDTPGEVGAYVLPQCKTWTAFAANDWGEHAELCGFAVWSRATWLTHPVMLANTKQWLEEESARYGIPLVKLDANDIRAGKSGVCGHVDVTAAGAGGNHWDPGPNFPWDVVLSGVAPVSAPAPAPPAPPTPPVPPAPAPASSAPPFPGRLLTVGCVGADVATWQQQMKNRGWNIAVDGSYGPISSGICRQFQSEKGLSVDGVVGPQTWAATWNAPIT